MYAGNLYGGVERMLGVFARECDAAGMEPAFALAFEGRLSDELRRAGRAPEMLGEVRMRLPWTVVRAGWRFARAVRETRPDVVVCHSAWSHALFGRRARMQGVPVVFWLHDAVTGDDPVERRAAAVPPDLAVCTSRFAQGTLPALFPHVRSDVVYPSVPPPPDLPPERARLRAELDTPADAVVIVQASRMEPWKGHRPHLEALGRLREVPGWVCWMAGGAQRPHELKHAAEMRRLAAELGIEGRVRFLGERGDVPRLLAAADVYCQPNLGPEPFGIAYVEAMYARLPVVASKLGGAAEIVTEHSGRLVAPGDVNALSAALAELVARPEVRLRLGLAGPSRARSLCDPAAQARRLRALLEGVTRARRTA